MANTSSMLVLLVNNVLKCNRVFVYFLFQKEKTTVSRLYTRMLQIHNRKPSMYNT